ncbi:MAG: transposase [Treponema sp.]|nr:transposase [Treponema sp.]
MRPLRILKQGVWYEIRTRINNRQPLFRHSRALALFGQVFQETELQFVFTVCALRLEDDWLTFYIKPEDGMKLPAIMKWIKQTFAQRYNRLMGWIGHLWGDRYWSRILEGAPPEGTEAAVEAAATSGPWNGVRPRKRKRGSRPRLPAVSPTLPAPAPG